MANLVNVRTFRLIASDTGSSISLNGKEDVDVQGFRIFFKDPTGFGLKNEIKTADLGYGFFHDLENKFYPAEPITGDLLFFSENGELDYAPYYIYRQFIHFVIDHPLILSYQAYGITEFFCKVKVEYLTKGELEKDGTLKVPVSFIPLTPWYLPNESAFTMRGITDAEMAFTYKESINDKAYIYDNNLIYSSPLVGSYSIETWSFGHLDSAIVVSYPGLIENPKLTLVGSADGTEYGICDVSGVCDGFEFSSLYDDSHIYDGEGNSLLNGVSPGKSPFFRLPRNVGPCILTLSASNTLTEYAKVKIYHYYRSV